MENKEKTPWEQAGYGDEISWKRAVIEEKVHKDYDAKRCSKESLVNAIVFARIAESERMDKIQELEEQVKALKTKLDEPVDHTSLSFDKMVEESVKKHLHITLDSYESGSECTYELGYVVKAYWDDKELSSSSLCTFED